MRLIADRIHRVAHCWFWRWPRIRLNQINWYALVYAADATVTGDPTLLRHDLRAQLMRFITGRRNFGAGLRFQYVPRRLPAAAANVDSAEYSTSCSPSGASTCRPGAPGWRLCLPPGARSSAAGSGGRSPATGLMAAT